MRERFQAFLNKWYIVHKKEKLEKAMAHMIAYGYVLLNKFGRIEGPWNYWTGTTFSIVKVIHDSSDLAIIRAEYKDYLKKVQSLMDDMK